MGKQLKQHPERFRLPINEMPEHRGKLMTVIIGEGSRRTYLNLDDEKEIGYCAATDTVLYVAPMIKE